MSRDDGLPEGMDLNRVMRRLKILEETSNHAIQEITRAGSLRCYVDKAFARPVDLIVLIGNICILKKYAEAAAKEFNFHMGLEEWNGFFMEFDKNIHVMPSGKVS